MSRPIAQQCSECGEAFMGSDCITFPIVCPDCENRPVCQDCGEKALNGYVAGDRCERLAKRNACVPETVCGGRLDAPTR